ncbi:MAG: hypothetical protein OET90_02735, partial [Desulfuromonadales bacterium]|nr:hypothetical protein [Desulfuromonadales bacterium]
TGATEMGGYQIDQNNGSPTSTWTLSGSAGLCILCHDEDSTGASVTVSTMNYFGTASTDWVGANGHANAVIGGNGTGSNIFNETDRKPSDGYCNPASGTDADSIAYNANGYCSGYPNMAYQHNSGTQAWGLRSTDSDGFSLSPSISARYPYNNYNWGATVDTGTTDSQYHEFSCSKCHNPHASRLPRLMMTNCLDTKHNSWDDPPPDTMLNGDTITISGVPTGGRRDCSADVNAAHTVDYLQMGSSIFLSSSFTTGCSNQDADILWNGTTYSLSGVTFVEPNEIQLDAADLASFVGREIPSTGSKNGNDAGAIYADNSEVTFSNATSAQNCHRVVDPDFSNAGGSGWNKVTPWTP